MRRNAAGAAPPHVPLGSSAFIGGKNPCLPWQATAPPPTALRAARAQLPRSPHPARPEIEPPSLLPSRGSSARRRRQHLQRCRRPGIRIAKELPPLRLGHVLPPRIL